MCFSNLAMPSEGPSTPLRVLFGAARKSGNARLRCLLASAYELHVINPRDVPSGQDVAGFMSWLDALPPRSVAGTSAPCSPELIVTAARNGITLIGVLRHPFDLFISNYDVAHQRAARERNTPEDAAFWSRLAGWALDGPEMLEYAQHGFGQEIAWLMSWHEGAAATVRFEQLETDPSRALSDLGPVLGERSAIDIAHAIEICPSENVVVSRPARGRRMSALPSGSWRERLPQDLQDILRGRYAEAVEKLGYDVA
jgi:hypothetical protein